MRTGHALPYLFDMAAVLLYGRAGYETLQGRVKEREWACEGKRMGVWRKENGRVKEREWTCEGKRMGV